MVWTDYEYGRYVEVANGLGVRPLDLLPVLYSESGLKPWAIAYVDGKPYALGLNQITPPAAPAAGLTRDQWAALPSMSITEQLPIVMRSLRASFAASGGRKMVDAGMIYASNFAPARLAANGGKSSSVMYRDPEAGYRGNKQLDFDKKGYITVGDLRRRLRSVLNDAGYRAHEARLRALYPGLDGPVIEAPENRSVSLRTILIPVSGVIVAVLGMVAMVGRFSPRAERRKKSA